MEYSAYVRTYMCEWVWELCVSGVVTYTWVSGYIRTYVCIHNLVEPKYPSK